MVKKISAFFAIPIVFALIFALLPLVHADNTNLISINDGAWYTDQQWLHAPALNVVYDTTDTYGGSPSWEIILSSVNVGADHGSISVKQGDVITFSCWIKTSAPTLTADVGNPQAGGRIGIDMYDSNGNFTDSRASQPNGGNSPTYINNTYVPFGSDWTKVVMIFTVASTYDGHVPSACIPWLQVWSDTQGTNEHGSGARVVYRCPIVHSPFWLSFSYN